MDDDDETKPLCWTSSLVVLSPGQRRI